MDRETDTDALVERACARWPGIAVSREHVAAALADCEVGPDDAHALDLVLAIAIATGSAAALAVFDREIIPLARAALSRFGRDDDFNSEILQQTRVRLVVADGGKPPRIAGYRGRGALSSWVQVVAIREALTALRSVRREVAADDELVRITFLEPVLARSREAHKRELAAALRVAMEELEPRQRNMLRLSVLDGVTGDQLATMFAVHRTTVFRWLREAREMLLARTREIFLSVIAVSHDEVDSLMRSLAGSLSVPWGAGAE